MPDKEKDMQFRDKAPEIVKEISPEQYQMAAENFRVEIKRRQDHKDRLSVEKAWKEVDRQVAMEQKNKLDRGREDWHPEFELPLQADALEVTVDEADESTFPGDGEFFNCHAQMTDEYIEEFGQDVGYSNGDAREGDDFVVSQEAIDVVNKAMLLHVHKKYRFQDKAKVLLAEGTKYGMFAARVRAIKKTSFLNEYSGVLRTDSIMPVVAPISIKSYYPDDIAMNALAHGFELTPTDMVLSQHRVLDLKMAANAKGAEGDGPFGGWLQKEVNNLEVDPDKPLVDFLEIEGDLIFPVKNGRDIIGRNMLVTMVFGGTLKEPTIIRIRENPMAFNSVFSGHFFQDKIGPYAMSPLMKGVALQTIAQEAAEDVVIVSRLNAQPVLLCDRNDPAFRRDGKYNIFPGAQIDSNVMPKVLEIGDIAAASAVFSQMTLQHQNTTGTPATRLGASQKSHVTEDAAMNQKESGQSRTRAFVRSFQRGFLTNVLHAESDIIRKYMGPQNVFLPDYSGYVTVSGKAMAPDLTFSVKGSASPFEKMQESAKMQQTIESLLKVEPMAVQQGARPLDLDYIRELFVRRAFPQADVARIFKPEAAPQPQPQQPQPQPQPQLPPGGQIPPGAIG